MMQAIGFWKGNDDRWLIHPKRLVDPNWQLNDRDKIVDYLRAGSEACSYLGYSWCRFDCGIAEEAMGSSELTDGVWCWPSGLAHYVEQHAVKLPDEFVEHAKSLSWTPAVVDEPELEYDLRFWRKWCKRNARSWWQITRQ